MKFSLRTYEIISFISACVLGVIFHFVYEWSGNNPVAALFFPINESTWEHLKLIFFPILIVSISEYLIADIRHEHFICIKLMSALIGMLSTVVLFYTYTGVIGRNIDFLNIIIFFIAMLAAWLYSFHKLSDGGCTGIPESYCIAAIIIIILMFAVFTLSPPAIALFISPV